MLPLLVKLPDVRVSLPEVKVMLPLLVEAPVVVLILPEVPVIAPLLVKKPLTVSALIPIFNVEPALIVILDTDVSTPKVTVLVLNPLPTITFGRLPVGVKTPKLAAPVNKIVPGPLTPFVVVPLFVKVPPTVSVCPVFMINLLVAALKIRLVMLAAAVTVTVCPVTIVTLSVASGTTPPTQVEPVAQFPLPALVIFAAFTNEAVNNKKTTNNK